MQDLARQLGIDGAAVFSGYRSDARELMQCMDVFVLCSFSEGTSLALPEATAACVPVIVTNVGGNPELILHRQNGWVVPSGSHEELAGAIEAYVEDGTLRTALAKSAADRFRATFTIDSMLGNYRKLYRRLLEDAQR